MAPNCIALSAQSLEPNLAIPIYVVADCALKTNVVVRVRRGVIQIQCEHSGVHAIVPVPTPEGFQP